MEHQASNESGNGFLVPVLIALAAFSQFTSCSNSSRVDKVEKQQAEIQAAIIEIREHRK